MSIRMTPRFYQAVTYAGELHFKQTRKGSGNKPSYMCHLFQVSGLAIEYGATEDEAIAAILHDAVEDQGGTATLNAIRNKFGDTVAEMVLGCTHAPIDATALTVEEYKEAIRKSRVAYFEHVRNSNTSVQLIIACDKLHNCRSMLKDLMERGEEVWKVFKGGMEGTIWYYTEMVNVLKASTRKEVRFLSEELLHTIDRINNIVRKSLN